MTPKEHQKKLLTEIMEADQKNGLYDISAVNKKITMTQQTYGEYMRSNPPIPNLTAVEWLIEQLWAPCRGIPSHIIEQAKQMEKEQIMESRNSGIVGALKGYSISNEDYYNETYGKE